MMKSKYENLKIIYNRSKLGWYWAPLFAISWFLVFYLVVLSSFYYYPEMLKVHDEVAYQECFIGERAEHTLLKLSKIGPKVVGSPANEQAALYILLNEIGNIKQGARKDLYDIEHEVQVASGNYAFGRMINAYQSIQNVIVKVTPKNVKSNVSLLLNSHFDSVPGSPGAGDDGLMVAVMLETLRVITKYETRINYSIVFLFNGAEETHLQGSHAFITQHKWAKNISAVINLDAAGSGGREMLFRAGPGSWLLKYYGSYAVHPYASTLADELFYYGFVPSDTDYRVFKDFGLSGLDMASILNGYVYHTKYDRFNVVPRGAYQSTGDNVLALTKALASAPEMESPQEQAMDQMVFFDVLGWFFISYSETTGLILNVVVCILAVLTILAYIWNMAHQTGMFRRRIFAKFGILLSIQFAAVIMELVLTISLAYLMDAIGLPLAWYSQKWMIFGLYFCPTFFVLGILPAIYLGKVKEHGLPLGYAIQLIMHSHCLLLVILTVVLTVLGLRSAYLVMISVAFYTLSVILNIATCFHKKTFLWLIPHIVCQFLPFLFYTYNCCIFYEALVPIAGRSGDATNPELMIAGIAALMSLLFAAFLIPIFWLFRKAKLIISCFALVYVISIIVAVTPVGFPYVAKESPQRFVVQHTIRTFHNGDPQMSVNRSDAGFYVIPFDRRTSSLDLIVNDTNFTGSESCDAALLCGYPESSILGSSNKSIWIPGPSPQRDGWPAIRILSKQRTSRKNILFTIEVTGPDHMTIYIKPVDDAKLVEWSFDQKALQRNRTVPYFVFYTYALDPTPLRFNLEFERGSADWSGATFDLVVMGHKLHHDIFYTEDFREFLAEFPPWTVVNAWMSSYESWRL